MQISIIKGKKEVLKFDLEYHGFKTKSFFEQSFDKLKDIKGLGESFLVKFKVGALEFIREFDEELTKSSWQESLDTVIEELKAFRESKREMISTDRTACMGAIRYKTVGGVFTKPNTVKALIGPDFKRRLLDVSKIPDSANKKPYVGIELEFCAFANSDVLKNLFIEANLHRYVHLGNDGSVHPHKGGHAYELRVLCLESEVETVISKVCTILNSKTVGGYVNSSCGLHVHLDCRNRDVNHVFKNLVMGLPMLSSMVPRERVSGVPGRTHYCKENDTGMFEKAKARGDRYYAINPMAYERNGRQTIEVRLHSGTTNANKITNWVAVLTSLVNHNKTLNAKIKTVDDFAKVNNDDKLLKFIARRIKTFETADIDTLMDDTLDQLIDAGNLAAIVNL